MYTRSKIKGWTIVPLLQTPIYTTWWILNCLPDPGLYVSPLYYPTTERLTIAESSLWLDSVQTCYFKSVHWSLPLTYRSQSTQHEISDIEICCSYAMRAHTALRNIYSTGCLLSSPRNSPTQRHLFPVCNASSACIISEKRLRFRKTFHINKSQRVTCGSIFRKQTWAASLLEENRSVVTLVNWNATQNPETVSRPSFLTADTALFRGPSHGRNGSHVSAQPSHPSLTLLQRQEPLTSLLGTKPTVLPL